MSKTNFFSISGENSLDLPVSREMICTTEIESFLVKEEWRLSTDLGNPKKLVYYQFDWSVGDGYSKDNVRCMLKALSYIRREIGTQRDFVNLLVHDEHSGASEASIFTALLYLIEKIDESMMGSKSNCRMEENKNQTIDIFDVVSNLRSKRMKMINCHDEYTFLFKAISAYAQNKIFFDAVLTSKDGVKRANDAITNLPGSDAEYVIHGQNDNEYFDGYKVYDYSGVQFHDRNHHFYLN